MEFRPLMSRSPSLRAVVLGAVLLVALAACGRRGALEPPPDPSAPKEQQTEAGGSGISGGGAPIARGKSTQRAITVPKTPFILDPLL